MQTSIAALAGALALGAMIGLATDATAQNTTDKSADTHDHAHDEHHDDDAIYKGIFDDDQIKDRPLSDWEGDWQSVYPLLLAGTLDPVMEHKAEAGEKTAEEYRAYYETGYVTSVDRIVIDGSQVTFYEEGGSYGGTYTSDGYEILTYESGARGVRFIFAKTGGDDAAPGIIQFSDHIIAPKPADHYHLYWGDDREALLSELTNWPTYFPSELTGDEVVAAMTAH